MNTGNHFTYCKNHKRKNIISKMENKAYDSFGSSKEIFVITVNNTSNFKPKIRALWLSQ